MENLPVLGYLSLKVSDLIEINKKGIKYGDAEVLFKGAVAETAICPPISTFPIFFGERTLIYSECK